MVKIELNINSSDEKAIESLINKCKAGKFNLDMKSGWKKVGVGGRPFRNVVLIPTSENIIIALPLKPFEEEVKGIYPHTQTARRDLEKEGFKHIDLTEALK